MLLVRGMSHRNVKIDLLLGACQSFSLCQPAKASFRDSRFYQQTTSWHILECQLRRYARINHTLVLQGYEASNCDIPALNHRRA